MDTNPANKVVVTIPTEEEHEQFIVTPLAVGFSAPGPDAGGEWMLIAFDEESGEQKAFPLVGMEIDALGDAHTEQLKQIVADRANVPTASEPPASNYEEGENAVGAADLTLVKDSE